MTIAGAELGQSIAAISTAQSTQADAAAKIKGKAKATAEQFEAMFLNTVFEQMSTGVDGDGPFGGSGALKVWRSMLTDQYAKSFAKTGGIGIASQVYSQLLRQQGLTEHTATAASGATKQ
jgi:Rod binding domain-containing protein